MYSRQLTIFRRSLQFQQPSRSPVSTTSNLNYSNNSLKLITQSCNPLSKSSQDLNPKAYSVNCESESSLQRGYWRSFSNKNFRPQQNELGETSLMLQEGTEIQEVPVAVLRSDPSIISDSTKGMHALEHIYS